jgi:hypothetical protein
MKKLLTTVLTLSIMMLTSLPFSFSAVGADIELFVQDKVSVKPEELPEPIKAALVNGAYANWEITEAFLITKEDRIQYYEITVKNGSETAKINLDKDGRKVE